MNNYSQIDLNKVKEEVANFAAIDDAKELIINEDVPFNPIIINRNILETNEILNLLKKDYFISFDGIENINDIFIKAKKDIQLTSIEASKVLNFHNHCKRIKDLLNKIDLELSVKDYSDSLFLDDQLFNEINKAVDNRGNIKDDASLKLKEIVDEIELNERQLYDTSHNFINKHIDSLQEPSIFTRNNRVCFLVKNSDKNKYNGYTYGTSASGLASYIEPEILVNINNRHISLFEDKNDEISRILMNITYIVGNVCDNYIDNFESIIKLNCTYAKAMYGVKNFGVLGKLSNEKNLCLEDVCHPLIDSNSVVSNTYRLFNPLKGIVISGTNTGGKTVGLKCIGLSVLMTYLGIPCIATSIEVPLYDNVYVDIDDNQSISNSLSTFSAHISNINQILNNASANSLILIDELISGTDPKEAQAISLAILHKIEKLNSHFIVTTHYDDIKNYAFNNQNIMLSSVGFDNKELKPTYKYIENSVGSSNALDIADRYFDDKELINDAKDIVNNNLSKEDELMRKLSKEFEDNININKQLKNKELEYQKLVNEYNKKINDFENQKEKLKKEYENSLNAYIENIKDKAIEKLDSIKEKKHIGVIDEIDLLKVNSKQEFDNFEVGDNVKVGDGDRIGTIISINNKKVEVDVNGISVKTELNNLTKMPKVNKKVFVEERKYGKQIKHEIVVVGKHVDEAIEEIEVFLDDALSNNLEQVKIIHGIGTGQLKSAIRENLKKLSFVKSFSDGDYHDGGSAVTMVKLK